jgi:hypothetical protein
VSDSSRQYDTISLPMTRPSPGEDNSKVIPSPPFLHVDHVRHWVSIYAWLFMWFRTYGDLDTLRERRFNCHGTATTTNSKMCSPSYFLLREPHLNERAHPSSLDFWK